MPGRTVGILLAALAVLGGSAGSADAAGPRVRVGAVAALPRGARVLGAVPAGTPLRLTVALQPQDPAGLAQLATQVATPGSPLFRHYLTVSQFAARFGATAAQLAAVQSGLRAAGLTVGAASANGLTIPLSGTAAQVQSALSVSLAQVRAPGGRNAFAGAQAPALPSAVARYVQGIIGLNNVTPDRPQALRQTAAARPCTQATQDAGGFNSSGALGYTADEIAGAYGLTSFYAAGDAGAGQTVALLEEEAYQPSDIAAYQSCFQTSVPVTNVDVNGGPGAYNPTAGDAESTLDIEQIIGLAPAAQILVYQAPLTATAAADILTRIVSEDRAQEISSSWGACEDLTDPAVIASENTSLQEAAVQGQSFFGSSGDSGSEMCYQATGTFPAPLSVIDPGSQPFATGVGGTAMCAGTPCVPVRDGSYPGESVWNDGGGDAVGDPANGTGGGVSDRWAAPAYQLGVIGSGSPRTCGPQQSAPCREVPDVSADADPSTGYTVFSDGGAVDGGWTVTGGTSASAPLWAAFTALTNDLPGCRGTSVGFENPALYAIAASSAYAADFHDITQPNPFTGAANNDTFLGFNPDDPAALYPLEPGYDMATGLGTPIAPALGTALCAVHAATVTVSNPGAQSSMIHRGVTLAIHAADSGGLSLSYTATGLPAGLTINPSTGVISGTVSAAGRASVTVTATDPVGHSGATQFSWTVAGPPAVSGGSLRRATKRKPVLRFTLAAGPEAPGLLGVTVSLPRGLGFGRRTRGIAVTGTRFKAKVAHGRLTLTFGHPVGRATVTIGTPALKVSSGLARKARRHKAPRLSIAIRALDAARVQTPLTFAVRP